MKTTSRVSIIDKLYYSYCSNRAFRQAEKERLNTIVEKKMAKKRGEEYVEEPKPEVEIPTTEDIVNQMEKEIKEVKKEKPIEEQKIQIVEEKPAEEEKKTEARTEQQIYAEAEHPVEASGAEKPKKSKKKQEHASEGNVDASMTGSVVITKQPTKLSVEEVIGNTLATVNGIKKDPNANIFDAAPSTPAQYAPVPQKDERVELNLLDFMDVSDNSGFDMAEKIRIQTQDQEYEKAVAMNMQNQNIPTQPIQQQTPVMQTFPQQMSFMNQFSPSVTPHKIDEPPKVVQKVEKSKPDVIEMDMPNPIDGFEVKPVEKPIDIRKMNIADGLVDQDKAEELKEQIEENESEPEFVNKYEDANKVFIDKYPFLLDIQNLAIECGYQIAFTCKVEGIIDCFVCDKYTGIVIPPKGFAIDTGMIINKSKKIYPVITEHGYEYYNPFFLFVKPKNSDKQVLNVEVLKKLIIGGSESAILDERPMFTPNFCKANTKCALITIPVKDVNKTARKNIQDKIVDLYTSGVLDKGLAETCSVRARFAVVNYSENGTLLLDTAGIPPYYGGAYDYNAKRVQIRAPFAEEPEILTGDNIINMPPAAKLSIRK